MRQTAGRLPTRCEKRPICDPKARRLPAVQPYESLILIDPDTTDERQDEIIGRVRDIVLGGGGTWDALDPWGKRKLSYEIDKKTEAHHWMVHFSSDRDPLAEVNRVLGITDEVVRHKTVRRRPVSA